MLGYVFGKNETVTIFAGTRQFTAAKDHPNYKKIVRGLLSKPGPKKEALILKLVDVPYALNMFTKGKAELRGDTVYYNGEPLYNELSRRLTELMHNGYPFVPMLRFIENVMMNPSERSRNELYKFLEHRALPITEDGCFLGYKKVRENYFDWHSNSFDNSIGKVHSMPRENVDPDCSQHCSTGFHVGTIEYADKQFHSGLGKLVVVKVNPMDAVSVPNDHCCQKIRVCKYEVVSDYVSELNKDVYGANAEQFVGQVDDEAGWVDDEDVYVDEPAVVITPAVKPKKEGTYHNVRVGGKFAKKGCKGAVDWNRR